MKKKHNRYEDIAFLSFLFALTVALYASALRVFFSHDDLHYLLHAAGLEQGEGLRRLMSLQWFFRVSWRLFGTHAWPYHAVIVLLHAVNGAILYFLARRLNLARDGARAASILFVSTYVAFIPLHWISDIPDVSVAFFALVSAYFFLGKGTLSAALSLVAVCASLLCKESTLFLLPALAIVLPVPKRRRVLLGAAGLALGLIVLGLSGVFESRPAGDPYESSFGSNILWNLLTYSGWLFRFWDYFPDRIPQYDVHMAGWGLILPAILCLIAWRSPKARRSIARAALVFSLTVAPVLPLVRHSYLYYLYLPLIPFWLVIGAYIGRISKRHLATAILAVFVLLSGANGVRHRRAEMLPGVPEDPILRYAAVARNAVESFRAQGDIPAGDYLIAKVQAGATINLERGPRAGEKTQRKRFSLIEQALLGGKALRLFFPAMQRILFEDKPGSVPGWQNMHLYITYGAGKVESMGYGEAGRTYLVSQLIDEGSLDMARQELETMLVLHPDDPALLGTLGVIARKQGNAQAVHTVIERLRKIASTENPPGAAHRELGKLTLTP